MNKIAVIGLGYVGLNLAVALSKNYPVIGYDISLSRIKELSDYFDSNHLISNNELQNSRVQYTTNSEDLREADLYIVVVSTPAYHYELPNLEPLINATSTVASVLKKGDIVIFESTVYPGTTEEICLPILEKISGLRNGDDFGIGYSPERIYPGDKHYTLNNIVKIVSGQNEAVLAKVKEIYESICEKVHPVSSIATAEAVKILENTQRDINIAFMNEFSQIMHALHLDMNEIIEGAKTKWSFAHFKPGFVGGHCIAVDPQYLIFKAKRLGVSPDLLVTARKINEGMPQFVMQEAIKLFIKNDLSLSQAKIGVFGISYKENVPDVRNSLALKFINILKTYHLNFQVHDPEANKDVIFKKYNLQLAELDEMEYLSLAIIIVGHEFYQNLGLETFAAKLKHPKILMDIPNIFVNSATSIKNYWNL